MKMQNIKKSLPFISSLFFIFLAGLSLSYLFSYVDLKPQVDNDAFFSSEDPNYQQDKQITALFPRKDDQIIISVTGNIFDKKYQEKISFLTEFLMDLENVVSVKSITHGPINIHDAIESPLWRRILIADNQHSSNIIIIVGNESFQRLLPKIEGVINAFEEKEFDIKISGFPYVVELIRRNLQRDLNIFSSLALALFGIIILTIFRSWRIFIGMVVTSVTAFSLTMIITDHLHIRIGILTANLATIIFVLTNSNVIFLTFNWRNIGKTIDPYDSFQAVKETIWFTIYPSFWSAVTVALGFGSLLFAQAKPLRELGISGVIGTTIAFLVVYGIYPSFLRLIIPEYNPSKARVKQYFEKVYSFFAHRHIFIIILIGLTLIMTLPKITKMDTDPSLLSFFKKNGDIYSGLEYIDKNGGSSPLVLVIKDARNQTLNTNKIYDRLWALHLALEDHPDIGTVVSLSTLLAEGKRNFIGSVVPSEWILDELERPQYDKIADSFVTRDRQYGMFLLRMNEVGRKKHRVGIINEIAEIVKAHGFVPHLFGGVYALQGYFSEHITSSLIYGLSHLTAIFFFIAWWVTRSLHGAIAMTLSLCVVTFCVLGGIGYLKIPLDTISAPATNVAISMGIDLMIHMVNYHRRFLKKHRGKNHIRDWIEVRRIMWEPIITSTLIVCSGFAIFFFSSFPPTQRFGGSIVYGSFISAMIALFIFPLLMKQEGETW